MVEVEEIKKKYPGADAWQMGDSPQLANELADLIKKWIKTASCGSFARDFSALKVIFLKIWS